MPPLRPFFSFPLALLLSGLPLGAETPRVDAPAAPGPKIDFNVVAESNAPADRPSAAKPAYFVLHDAGYVEKGDPLANDTPPPPAAIASALRRALAQAHYLPADPVHRPSLLLVSSWGTLRRDSMAIAPLQELDPNLRARLGLVATRPFAERIERELLDRKIYRLLRAPPMLSTLSFAERDVLDLARDDRYFIIVAAFDYAAATRKEIKPVWRVKLSTRNVGAAMPDALAALIRTGQSWYGRNEAEPRQDRAALFAAGQVHIGAATEVAEAAPPTGEGGGVDAGFQQDLVRQEQALLAGARPSTVPASAPAGSERK